MTTVRIQNQTESLLMINGLDIRMDSKDTPNSIAIVKKDDLLNPELAQLINLGLVKKIRKTRKRKNASETKEKSEVVTKKEKSEVEKEPKEKAPSTPEDLPYEKNSEVVMARKDGEIIRTNMVQDITGDKETIFLEGESDKESGEEDNEVSDYFLEADEQNDKKDKSDDDAFIEV